jgi:hypothetical protein
MGGVWDPVSDDFKSDNFGFHMMMVLYFFTSVVLMLNVLIALINVAFNKGDDGWRLTWIEWRIRYIEAAENMSYHIPGFRQTYDFFPDEIYFSVPHKQWQEQKFDAENHVVMGLDMTENSLKEGDDENDALEAFDEDEELEGKQDKRKNCVDHDNTSDGNVEDSEEQEAVVEDVLESQVESLGVADSVLITEETSSIQQDNQDCELIRTLSMQVEGLNSEVRDLHQQIANLQQQVENQFEELKRLLQHSAR